MSFVIAIIQLCACFGFGAAVLKALKANEFNMPLEHLAWAGCIGLGVLGWLMYFIGLAEIFTPYMFALTLGVGCCGMLFLWRAPMSSEPAWVPSPSLNAVAFTLLILIGVVFSFDTIEALAPPTDADTLAYHYAIPRQLLDAGKIVFIPRAVDGAVPLLIQMTYLPVLSLGGDQSLTLWSMFSGYLVSLLVFVVARHHVNTTWCLALVLLLISTPALIAGSGNGQVEVRNAAFLFASAMALIRGIKTSQTKWFILAGITAGFFMGSKYSGLFYVAAAGLSLLIFKPNIRYVMGFSLSVCVAGTQWYFWNWLNTGDPIFPALYGLLPYADPLIWNQELNDFLNYRLEVGENVLPKTPFWALAYPFMASFGNDPILQGSRVGFGVAAFIIALPAIFVGYKYRRRLRSHPLMLAVSITLIFYALWYFLGPSQRVRHFLPIYPLALFLLIIAAAKWASFKARVRIMGVVLVPVILMQLGAQFIYVREAISYQLKDISETEYLLRNVSDFGVVPWINANLPEDAHVLSDLRQLEYYMKPKLYFYDVDQALISRFTPSKSPESFWQQLRTQNITHVVARHVPGEVGDFRIWKMMMSHGCGAVLQRIQSTSISSRTLRILGAKTNEAVVIELSPETCAFEKST